MEEKVKNSILELMGEHNIMTLATIREDGYPQATTVAYANDGLTIYAVVSPDSQKVHNIKKCNKVSLTIDRDYEDWNQIKGLSMGAIAEIVTDPDEFERAIAILENKFPQIASMSWHPTAETVALLKITPKVISVLNYALGFGHTDLIEV
ncbi:MAG: pyridoxamine 5'-phosphate oxidase family protein [Hydrococcus sp. C42_A2020_068]|nr:pyridoxamine 5'-phosphate oxidase family protein [Hydrococcus sp. C42_A2020_068]